VRALLQSEAEGLRFQDCAVALKGVLLRRSRVRGAYRPRLFALTDDGGLHCFKSASGRELRAGSLVHLYECRHKGCVRLLPGAAPIDAGEQGGLHGLIVAGVDAAGGGTGGGSAVVQLAAPTREEAEIWLAALRRVQGGMPGKLTLGNLRRHSLSQTTRSLFS
jgi:hypothetical protein